MNTYKLKQEGGKILYRQTEEEHLNIVHYVHDTKTSIMHPENVLQELKEDIYDCFLVFENCTNFPYVHLLTASSADDAIQIIYDYQTSGEDFDYTEEEIDNIILSVARVEL